MTTLDSQHLDAEQLSALVDERLEPAERERATAHLASCGRCAADLAELRATVDLLRGLPELEPPRSFLLAETVRPPLALRLAPWTRTLGALAAALFVVLLSVDLLTAPAGSGPGVAQQTEALRSAGTAVPPKPTEAPKPAAPAPAAPAAAPKPAAQAARPAEGAQPAAAPAAAPEAAPAADSLTTRDQPADAARSGAAPPQLPAAAQAPPAPTPPAGLPQPAPRPADASKPAAAAAPAPRPAASPAAAAPAVQPTLPGPSGFSSLAPPTPAPPPTSTPLPTATARPTTVPPAPPPSSGTPLRPYWVTLGVLALVLLAASFALQRFARRAGGP